MMGFVVFIFLICYMCTNIICQKINKGAVDDSDFCYADPNCGPKEWAGLCNSGHRQSPIDLDGNRMGLKILPPTYRQFYAFSISDTKTFIMKNTGQSVQVKFPVGKEPVLKGATIGLPGSYRFSKMELHWGRYDKDGSEHRIYGKGYASRKQRRKRSRVSSIQILLVHQVEPNFYASCDINYSLGNAAACYAMELQLVHYSTVYTNYEQASISELDPYAVSIISILYDVGPLDNLGLKPITDAIPLIRHFNDGAEITVNRFLNLKAFFPAFLSFYRYEGSLTTPSCYENRVWSVFQTPNKISKKQLEELRSIFTRDNIHLMVDNHRFLQKRNDRAVTLYFTPSNIYDWMMQLAIYMYTFVRQIMAMPKDLAQEQLGFLIKPFASAQLNLQNGLLSFTDLG